MSYILSAENTHLCCDIKFMSNNGNTINEINFDSNYIELKNYLLNLLTGDDTEENWANKFSLKIINKKYFIDDNHIEMSKVDMEYFNSLLNIIICEINNKFYTFAI